MKNYNVTVPLTISGNFRLGDIRHNYADLSKISTTLGFKPLYSFEEGIKIFSEWVLTQKIEESKYEKSVTEMKDKGLLK